MRSLKNWVSAIRIGWFRVGLRRNGSRRSVPVATEPTKLSVTESGRDNLLRLERTVPNVLQGRDGSGNELLYGIAHELKAPLTAIIFSTELLSILERLDASPDGHKESLIQNIAANARRVNRRISDLVDFMRAQSGDLELEPGSVEIGPVISEVASELLILFNRKGQALRVEVPDGLPKVRADRARLEQVLSNLLENANEMSPDGSNVVVTVREVGKRVVVEVRDSAPAIVEGETGRLFDLSYHGDGKNGRQLFPSLGPGLAISKQLVELHEGEIWVESEVGTGNTFAFSLPMAAPETDKPGESVG